MTYLILFPFIFLLYYVAGAGAAAFIGTTFLLVPFAREFFRKGIPTPLFFLVSGAIMGAISKNIDAELLKDIFEISTLFLAYAASYEFASAFKNVKSQKVLYGVILEFIVVVLVLYVFFHYVVVIETPLSLLLSMLFLSISPITSMILLHENNVGKSDNMEAGILLRDILQILLLILLFHVLKRGHAGASGILLSIVFSPILGVLLTIGEKVKKGTYLFLPLMIVIAIVFEMQYGASAVFTVIFAAVWQRLLSGKSQITYRIIDIGKIFYPFVYTYTGQLIVLFGIGIYLLGFVLLVLKIIAELIVVLIKGTRTPFMDISVKIPMAGLSLHHLFSIRDEISVTVFSAVAFALVASEFLAPLFILAFRTSKRRL